MTKTYQLCYTSCKLVNNNNEGLIVSTPPLVVDLDGTLIHTDMLHESAFQGMKKNPLAVLKYPYWLSKGKTTLKANLANRSAIQAASLPYNQTLLNWLHEQKEKGRQLILCTASHISFAQAVAKHLNIFHEVIASSPSTNLSGKNKARLLTERFGEKGFDYAGNARCDIAVWKQARRAILVNTRPSIAKKIIDFCEIEIAFPAIKPTLKLYAKALRTHQWVKNLLLFIPLIAAHEFTHPMAWLTLIFAFFAFSLCASSVYITNDLLDLESDRKHPSKSRRPFASGKISALTGIILAPLLCFLSFSAAFLIGKAFTITLAIYFLITCAYSFGLKRLVLVDCITLAILYTMRIIAGAAAAHQPLTFWLLAFSVFLFLSLAFVKRYVELMGHKDGRNTKVSGRGYYTDDAPLIQTFGVTSGYTAALVLALYLNSDAVLMLYPTPEYIWGTVPLMLFWVSFIWIQAHRGKVHDDPVIFAVKNKTSLITGGLFFAFLILGSVGFQ